MWRMALFYCEIQYTSKNSLISIPIHLILYIKIKLLTDFTNSLLFWAISITLSLTGLATLLYFLYIFKTFYIFYFLYFISCFIKLPSLLVFFPRWLLPNKLFQILPLFSKTIVYLCKRIHTHKKYHPWGIFIFWQLVVKNSEFCSFSIRKKCIYAKPSCIQKM